MSCANVPINWHFFFALTEGFNTSFPPSLHPLHFKAQSISDLDAILKCVLIVYFHPYLRLQFACRHRACYKTIQDTTSPLVYMYMCTSVYLGKVTDRKST